MAEKRRLQGEIDRTLKKVNEGRMSFKETLDKFESSTNHAQKEKHEADLKKEIKKLQRFRDNIKTWLTNTDVKDKTQLTEMRKLIESDMERFKVIEKETKTKAYSKEGLYIETKKDPLQREKEDHLEWLKVQISKLSKNIETSDFEITKLNPVKKKRNVEKERLIDLNQKLSMFKNHLLKQETLMRLLDNDKIEMDKVKDFRYAFEDFIMNPDNEVYKGDQGLFIYDELNLDELSADISMAAELDTSTTKLDTPSNESVLFSGTTVSYLSDKKDSIIIEKIESLQSTIIDSSNNPMGEEPTITDSNNKTVPAKSTTIEPTIIKPKENNNNKTSQKSNKIVKSHIIDIANSAVDKSGSIKPQTSTPIKSSSVPLDSSDYLSIHNVSDSSIKDSGVGRVSTVDTPTEAIVSSLVSCQQINTANTPVLETVASIESTTVTSLKDNYPIDVIRPTVVSLPESYSIAAAAAVTTGNYIATAFSANNHEPVLKSAASIIKPKLDQGVPPVSATGGQFLDIPSCQGGQYFDMGNTFLPPMMSQNDIGSLNHQFSQHRLLDHSSLQQQQQQQQDRQQQQLQHHLGPVGKDSTIDMILEPGDAMSPFRNHAFQSNDYYINQVSAMEHGRLKQPLISDSEKARLIIHKNETQVPDYFPRDPSPGNDTEEYYMRLDSDTLFFIFYYFEGTKAQYLAAKALKRMSWRFHTGHMCWFQRHEEPKQITDNSESGTYIFYDFESMSRQKKENFTFSYNFLEDKDF